MARTVDRWSESLVSRIADRSTPRASPLIAAWPGPRPRSVARVRFRMAAPARPAPQIRARSVTRTVARIVLHAEKDSDIGEKIESMTQIVTQTATRKATQMMTRMVARAATRMVTRVVTRNGDSER